MLSRIAGAACDTFARTGFVRDGVGVTSGFRLGTTASDSQNARVIATGSVEIAVGLMKSKVDEKLMRLAKKLPIIQPDCEFAQQEMRARVLGVHGRRVRGQHRELWYKSLRQNSPALEIFQASKPGSLALRRLGLGIEQSEDRTTWTSIESKVSGPPILMEVRNELGGLRRTGREFELLIGNLHSRHSRQLYRVS